MKLGLFTACLGRLSLDRVAAWAAASDFDALEVAAWPAGSRHVHQATHIDVERFTAAEASRVQDLLARHGLTLSAVSYYGNNLHGDRSGRRAAHDHVKACITTAAALGVPRVGTFIGRDPTRSVAENLRLAEQADELPALVAFADDHGVHLVVENGPMEVSRLLTSPDPRWRRTPRLPGHVRNGGTLDRWRESTRGAMRGRLRCRRGHPTAPAPAPTPAPR